MTDFDFNTFEPIETMPVAPPPTPVDAPLGKMHRAMWCRPVDKAATVLVTVWAFAPWVALVAWTQDLDSRVFWARFAVVVFVLAYLVTVAATLTRRRRPATCAHQPGPVTRLVRRLDAWAGGGAIAGDAAAEPEPEPDDDGNADDGFWRH